MSDTERVTGPDDSGIERAPTSQDNPADTPGEAGSERARNVVDQVGDDLQDLEREYQSARSAIADEDSDRRSEAAELLAGGSDRHELVIELVALRSEFSRQGEALSARDEHVKSLREQVGDLESRLERTNATAIRVTELENDTRRLGRENEKLGALLDAREVERDEISAKLRSVEVDKVQLRRETESLQTDMSGLDTERSEMRKQLQKLEAELVRNRRDHEARRVQLEASAEERNEMSKKLSSLQEDRAADLGRINELEGLVERRSNEINHLKKTAARTDAELSRIGDAATELELRSAERDKLRRRVESLESELTAQTTEAGASKKALELLASRTSERDELEKRVIELERDLVKLTSTAATGKDVVSQLEARTEERNDLEQRLVGLEAELARERMQNAEWRETADLVAQMTSERDKLRRRVSVLEAELESTTAAVPLRSTEIRTDAIVEQARSEVAEKVETASADDALMLRIAALEQQLNARGAGPASREQDDPTQATTAAAAAFDEAMESAAEMRAKLARAAELLGNENTPAVASSVGAPISPPSYESSSGTFSELTNADPVAPTANADDPALRAELDESEPLWALRAPAESEASAEVASDVDDGPSDQVYNMYRETLKNLEYDEETPVEAPVAAAPASRESADLASALFSRTPQSEAIPGVDLAAAPPPSAPPIAQVAPPPAVTRPTLDRPAMPAAPPAVTPAPIIEPAPAPARGGEGRGSARPQKSSRSRRRRGPATPSSVEAADAILTSGAHVLVDGNGVMAQTRFPHRFLDAMERLAARREMSVELVFDSDKVEATPALATRNHVQVRFAQGVDVGDVIARLLDTIPANTPTVVATDDGRLRSEARKLRADVINMGQITGVVSR